MKKSLLNLAVLGLVSLNFTSVALAGPFDFITEDKKTESKGSAKAVDLDKMSASGNKLILNVAMATIHFADAGVKILEAVGKKEDAAKLEAMSTELKSKKSDPEGIKKIMESQESQKAMEALGKIGLSSKTKLNLSVKDLTDSLIKVGSGLVVDSVAINDASNLVQEAKGIVQNVQSDPMKYGLGAVGTVNSIIGSGKFIADNVPKQVTHVKTFSDQLIAYFKANNIPLPSQATITKASASMGKE